MCGIVGIAALGAASVRPVAVERRRAALAALAHRGPDAHGEFCDDHAWLGHTRLSVIDLSNAGRQPMCTRDNRFVISYNGEVYNFRRLAREHDLAGLRSGTDTEVVLRLFAKDGVESLTHLNGMFAFSVYDTHKRKLYLVRDRLGIKPLFYRVADGFIAFSSEIKGIRALLPGPRHCDFAALHEWLYFGNPLGGRTLFAGIGQLPPGHFLEIDLDSSAHSVQSYWSLRAELDRDREIPADDETLIRQTRDLLENAVRRQLVSDVPVGVFLSGGVDSSAIVAFASRHYQGRLTTYSVGFDYQRGEGERPRARRVARQFGTDHHELHIAGDNVADLIGTLVRQHDMPFADPANIPLYLMASRISSTTRVVLQGDGGDELFGGYRRYATLAHYRLLHRLAPMLGALSRIMPASRLRQRAGRYLEAFGADRLAETMALLLTVERRSMAPEKVFQPALRRAVAASDPFRRFDECQSGFVEQDIANQMSMVDLMIVLPETYLEKVDRATMAASLEVRVPFLDHELVDFVVGIPGTRKMPRGTQKWLLKSALDGIVPEEVLNGPKSGLSVPYASWLRGPLKPVFFDQLARFSRSSPDVLDAGYVQKLFARTASGRADHSHLLWKLLMLMVWQENAGVIIEMPS
jgi:asparagine synthase (glutamine-hydrolysing)